jgi:hypothetical protein
MGSRLFPLYWNFPMYRYSFALGFGLVLVWIVGCTQPPNGLPPSASVTGTVNMDNKPIASGEIHFSMMGVPPSALTIKDGAFSGPAPIGKNMVEVFIYVESGPADKPSKKNIIPERYWGPNTTLDAEVTAAGPNEFKFNLTSNK